MITWHLTKVVSRPELLLFTRRKHHETSRSQKHV